MACLVSASTINQDVGVGIICYRARGWWEYFFVGTLVQGKAELAVEELSPSVPLLGRGMTYR
jgi:hypothetical protein